MAFIYECGCAWDARLPFCPVTGHGAPFVTERDRPGRDVRKFQTFVLEANDHVEFERFWNEQGEWSEKTFGSSKVRGPLGPLQHLEKEAIEAQTEVAEGGEKLHEEIADCLFLTLDAARRSGLTAAKLLEVAFQKLEKNKQREWGPFNPNGPTEHIREQQ
jgi:NTP pyrophosphatase (non-canonical NTP hydrolase)